MTSERSVNDRTANSDGDSKILLDTHRTVQSDKMVRKSCYESKSMSGFS